MTNGTDHQISDYYVFHYTYMRDQELTQITAPSPGFSYDPAYDALGRCVKRSATANNTTTTTYYIYDGDKPILEYNANNALVGFNVYGKGVDEILQRGAYGADNLWHWYFLNQDHEGSVTHLTRTFTEQSSKNIATTPLAPRVSMTVVDARNTTSYNNRFLIYRQRIFRSMDLRLPSASLPRLSGPVHERRPEAVRRRRLQSLSLLPQ